MASRVTLFGSHLTCREDGGQRSCASWHLHSRAYWQCVSWIRLRPRPSVQRRLKQQARTNRLFLLRPIVAVPGIVIAAAARKFRSRNITTKRARALKAIASCALGGHRCDRRGTCAPMPSAASPFATTLPSSNYELSPSWLTGTESSRSSAPYLEFRR